MRKSKDAKGQVPSLLLAAAFMLCAASARAATGMLELPANDTSGPVTLFYPTGSTPQWQSRGPFRLEVALDAEPSPGNGRLVVVSHGSTGMPWVHTDLAHTLVAAGFTVVFPEHQADNDKDSSEPGPPSWRRRPVEVSKAIDRVSQEPAFASRLDFGRVGMFGMSAGGHTALTLAGGRWSPALLGQHCQRHLEEDFTACAGPLVALTGGLFDGVKKFVVKTVHRHKFDDATWYGHSEPRIVSVVAGVPFAADFEMASLRTPRTALALVIARQDRWLRSPFHGEAVAQACTTCERLADLQNGGHGALLGPLPPSGALSELLDDPAGFDRAREVPRLNRALAEYFQRTVREGR